MSRTRSLIAALLALLAVPAAAGQLDDGNPRPLPPGEASRGWEGVGRLDLGQGSFCTGALIAPRLVLTAAHCLYRSDNGGMIDLAGIEFRAGWRDGRAAAYRGVRRVLPHPDYRYDAPEAADRIARDIALLELDRAIGADEIAPFSTRAVPARGASVTVVSYARGRAEIPSLQDGCRVIGHQRDLLILSCAVDFGASGAPVYLREDGKARIVSVVSAMAELAGRPVSLAAGLGGPLTELRAAMDAGAGVAVPQPAPGVGSVALEAAHTASGAKFVRPEKALDGP